MTLTLGEYHCVSSQITEEMPPPQLAFILQEGGVWTDTTFPTRPLEGSYEYSDGVATFYDADGGVQYYFKWALDSSGREQLAELINQDEQTGVFCSPTGQG